MRAGISDAMPLNVMSKQSDLFAHHFRFMLSKQASQVRVTSYLFS